MKKLQLIFLALLVLGSLSRAQATDAAIIADFNPQVTQGNTQKICFSSNNFSRSEVNLGDKQLITFNESRELGEYEPINRGEFIKLLDLNQALSNSRGSISFNDVGFDYPHKAAIEKAAAQGIISGFQDGNFYPYKTLTRGQAAKILTLTYGLTELNQEPVNYPDLTSSHYFYDYFQRAIAAGLFKGYPDGLIRPNRELNYQEALILIKRASGKEVITKLGPKKSICAFAGIHRTRTDLGMQQLKIKATTSDGHSESAEFHFEVIAAEFPTESFYLVESKQKLLGKEYQDNTWELINAALSESHRQKWWQGEFITPAQGTVTLEYGEELYINGRYSGSHFGIDYANSTGTKIIAANKGKVTLASWTPTYGNTIIIDHGFNVFTMYLHLDSMVVEKRQLVEKGQTIGTMGMTGVATGPHLHYTQFIGQTIVNPEEWLEGRF
jgi:hypothetical protein